MTLLIMAGIILCCLLMIYILLFAPTAIGGEELNGAKLFLNEKTLRITRPIKLSGRPDQVWRRASGKLAIVDTKRRKNTTIYESDRVQLSSYRYILRRHPRTSKNAFDDFGFIRVKIRGKKAEFVRVKLYEDDEIERLHERATALRRNRAQPVAKPARALCKGCGHRKRCRSAL
ncbi:MAG: PD-(D/E)XK nuclease family protein [Pseudomonadota bacterium]